MFSTQFYVLSTVFWLICVLISNTSFSKLKTFIVNRRHSIVNKADSWWRIKMGLSKFLDVLNFLTILSLVILIKRILIKKNKRCNANLKISLYVRLHMKITQIFRNLNLKNFLVIYPLSLQNVCFQIYRNIR